jgi:hypothetical protein
LGRRRRRIRAPLTRAGTEVVEFTGDPPYDFIVRKGSIQVRIQVKLQRLEKGVPKIASKKRYPSEGDLYLVEVQKTRGGIDPATNEDTRPYRFGEFDILAVGTGASSSSLSVVPEAGAA